MALITADPSVSAFPEELLTRIFHFTDDQATLAHVARSTKQFYRVVLPELYSNPCLLGRGPLEGVKHLLPFLWRMIKCPGLADNVISLQIRGGISSAMRVIGIPAAIPSTRRLPLPRDFRKDADYQRTRDDFTTIFKYGNSLFSDIVESAEEDAVIPVLLMKTVKLKKLGLTIPNQTNHIFSFFRDDPAGRKCLTGLREIMITFTYPNEHMSPQRWMRVLGKPTLDRLYVRNTGGNRDTNWDENWEQPIEGGPFVPPATFSVTHVEFRNCVIFENELNKVLCRCKALNTFVYELGWPHGDRWSREDIIDLHLSLYNHCRHTIQNLSITCRWWDAKERTMSVPQLHFHSFEALTFLKISPVLLLGEEEHVWKRVDIDSDDITMMFPVWQLVVARTIENLPPSLQKLHITECIQVLRRDQAAAILASVIEKAPLTKFRELVLLGEIDNRSEYRRYLMQAEHVAARTVHSRGFDFTLQLLPCEYYYENPRSRGWGMEDEIRWAFDNDNFNADIEHWKWNKEIFHLSKVARDGELLFAPYWYKEPRWDKGPKKEKVEGHGGGGDRRLTLSEGRRHAKEQRRRKEKKRPLMTGPYLTSLLLGPDEWLRMIKG